MIFQEYKKKRVLCVLLVFICVRFNVNNISGVNNISHITGKISELISALFNCAKNVNDGYGQLGSHFSF